MNIIMYRGSISCSGFSKVPTNAPITSLISGNIIIPKMRKIPSPIAILFIVSLIILLQYLLYIFKYHKNLLSSIYCSNKTFILIILYQGLGLLLIYDQPVLYCFFLIILTLI